MDPQSGAKSNEDYPPKWGQLRGAHPTKALFDANRSRYDEGIAGPSKALVESLAGLLPDRLGCDVRAEAKVGRSLFRINRDTRFATDKTPYKTHLDFLFWIGDGPPRTQPAFIMRITTGRALVGGGRMGLTGRALDVYRAALDDPNQGATIRQAVDTLVSGGAELSDPDRSKPPRPFSSEHPSGDLLRRDGFHVSRPASHPSCLASVAFAGWCADRLAPFVPIVAWFAAMDP